jgi:ABC-type sulfate transport system permease component
MKDGMRFRLSTLFVVVAGIALIVATGPPFTIGELQGQTVFILNVKCLAVILAELFAFLVWRWVVWLRS